MNPKTGQLVKIENDDKIAVENKIMAAIKQRKVCKLEFKLPFSSSNVTNTLLFRVTGKCSSKMTLPSTSIYASTVVSIFKLPPRLIMK